MFALEDVWGNILQVDATFAVFHQSVPDFLTFPFHVWLSFTASFVTAGVTMDTLQLQTVRTVGVNQIRPRWHELGLRWLKFHSKLGVSLVVRVAKGTPVWCNWRNSL